MRIAKARSRLGLTSLVTFLAAQALSSVALAAITVNVVDPAGDPVEGFRWLLEEDNTHPVPFNADGSGVHVTPGAREDNPLSLSIHYSHAPTVAGGETTDAATTISTLPDGVTPLPSDQRYVLSVLPFRQDRSTGIMEYTMGGANIAAGQTDVTIIVTPNPIATAQISVLVFEDNAPLNNAPDVTERRLEGFSVELFDTADLMFIDAFGNPLGTVYEESCGPSGDDVCLDGDGAPIVEQMGNGVIYSDANGEAFIRWVVPGKYGVRITPPAGEEWYQVTTIEGSPTIDAWVRPNEPPFLVEFGPPFWHTFYGFVQKIDLPQPAPGEPFSMISGQVNKGHQSRPPRVFFDGTTPTTSPCLIGLNRLGVGLKEAVAMVVCEDDGLFTIPNVPPGLYQLVIWDLFLDHIISFATVNVPADGSDVSLGSILTPMWFGEQEHYVFSDTNANGVWDADEQGIPEQNVNLRNRDGTIYKAFPTDGTGFVPFEEIFPFFRWQIAEVDFARLQATGLTVTIDDGGLIPTTGECVDEAEGKRTPQLQVPEPDDVSVGDNPCVRTELGPILLEAYQSFAGNNVRFDWGKRAYPPGQNGGISGIAYFTTTRAEDDPRFAAGEEWEPGIPRLQINLYEDNLCGATPCFGGDKIIDDVDGSGDVTLADSDNHPLGWADGGPKGPEDVDWNGNGDFDMGDAVRVAWADSWDDSWPEGCRGNDAVPLEVHGETIPIEDCAEGLRTWTQVRPGVFDGGWAFGGPAGEDEMEPGFYIVEGVAPPGYQHIKEENRNVDFGLVHEPSPLLLPPECVGDVRTVPQYFSFLTDAAGNLLPGHDPNNEDNFAPFAGEDRPLCDKKHVSLSDGQNAAVEFFFMSEHEVPKAARVVGLISDDFAQELDPRKPNFVEKFSPAWMPIAFFDYSDTEIGRVYSDEFGNYNALMPSTYSIDVPSPTGVGPQMHQVCLNHPGPIADPNNAGATILDPHYDPRYSTTCYNFDFWPGKTTYLDTPVIRLAAFVGPSQQTLDCECPDRMPVIDQVTTSDAQGPWVSDEGSTVTIRSAGTRLVRNPAYPGEDAEGFPADPPINPQFIERDYGFGVNEGRVFVGDAEIDASLVTWSDSEVSFTVPAGLSSGQLMVRSTGMRETKSGVTLTVGGPAPTQVLPGQSIQAAVDAADDGDLILVAPGVYHENIIVYRDLRLQGAGPATEILAIHYPGDALNAWRLKLRQLFDDGQLGLLPGQENLEPIFRSQEGPGFMVIPRDGVFDSGTARIDGFTIRGADLGGGIFVNAFAYDLEIANNRLINNLGTAGGGIRIGNPATGVFAGARLEIDESPNDRIHIHHNQILENGSNKAGGGIAVYTGADDYVIEQNFICGNFARLGGGGISHRGVNDNGLIADNQIVYNEVFQGDEIRGFPGGGGGGVELAGEPRRVDDPPGTLSEGTGSVQILRNLLQGNLAGALDGGGISLGFVNGQDVVASGDPNDWYSVDIWNNMIVNNVAGLAGGGISLQDALRVTIIHNTIAHNDSAATAADAFAPGAALQETTPQIAGVVSRVHSDGLLAVAPDWFSNPEMANDILWQNRSWYWDAFANDGRGGLLENPAGLHQDLGVVGTGGSLDPMFSILTDTTGYDASNLMDDPAFGDGRFNALITSAAADEGGNFIQVYYTPLGLNGDYHLATGSPAINSGTNDYLGLIADDIDGQSRPIPANGCVDMGADEAASTGVSPCSSAIPQAPIARNDRFFADTYFVYEVPPPGVLGNDSDGNGDPLTAHLVNKPANQNIVLNLDGSIVWTPKDTKWVGEAPFSYVANDGTADSNLASVRIVKEMSVTKAEYKEKGKRWNLKGNSIAPVGTTVTIYLGSDLSGPVIGQTQVFLNANGKGQWTFTQSNSTVLPGGETTISLHSNSDANAGAGAMLFGAPLTVEALPPLEVTRAEFREARNRWIVNGKSTAPAGTTITIYLGPNLSGQIIGTTQVFLNTDGEGQWKFDQLDSTVLPDGETTISVHDAFGVTQLGVPFTVVPAP